MRPDPAVKAKAHPKWREDTSVRSTLPSPLSMGRLAVAPVEQTACSKLLKNWVPGGSMPLGAARALRKGGKERKRQ